MVEEIARHVGHPDAIPEQLLGGTTGCYRDGKVTRTVVPSPGWEVIENRAPMASAR